MNQSAMASWRRGCNWRSLASFRHAAWVFAWTTCGFASSALPHPVQQSNGNAIIVGVVVDENHRPVPRALVQAFSVTDARETSGGVQGLIRSRSAYTDSTGTFRISGLAEGDYLVAAEATSVFPSGGQVPARMWAPTFFPSTADVSEATPVPAWMHPSASVTIELVPVTPVRVRGTVATASGRSPEGFGVGLYRRFGGFAGGGPGAVVGAKGMFEIPRVPPGVYELIIEPRTSQPGDDGREFVDQMIEVTDRDLSLSLNAGPGASLTGHVISEPASVVTTPIGLRVTADHDRNDGKLAPGRSIQSSVDGDWSFRMTGLSGSCDFFASSDRSPAIVATRVVVDGTSYPGGKSIALTEGHHDVVVVVAPRDPPKPAVDTTLTPAQLVEQFRSEKFSWKQFDIGKAIVEKHDASVLPALTDWLEHPDRHIRGNVAFVFAGFGDPRGLQTITDILADRSERPEGQGIATGSGLGGYNFERQVAADRHYAVGLLGQLRDPGTVELLLPLLDDPELQSSVPWSLGHIGDKRAIPPLIAALERDDPSMRVLVIYALEALHAQEAIPRLMTLINDDRKSHFGALVTVSEAAKAAIAALR